MPAAAVTSYTYDANGNRTGTVTPEGYRISREYDCRDRLSMERVQDQGNGIDLRTFFAYDDAGNVASVRQQDAGGKMREVRCSHDLKDRLTRVEELDGPVVQAAYDRNDRMSGRRDILPSDGERYGETLFCYDVRGNLVERRRGGKTEEARSYDRKGRLTGHRDGDGVEVRCRYGIQEGMVEITTASSREQGRAAQALAYNARGMAVGMEDGCGNETGYAYDAWGRVTAVRTAEGGLEEYAYDQAGNVAWTKDANGGRIRYAHNSMGLVCAVTDQCGNTETFRYDKEGRETEHTDRNGTVTETKYNLYGQPVLQSCTDKDGERQVMGAWEYDSFGQPTKAVAGGSCYTYEYRPDGKLLNKWSSGKLVESCTYYRDGSLRSLTDASGKTVRYEYDDAGRLEALRDEEDGLLAEYRYTAAGRIREVITKGGIKTAYAYDEDGNISRLTIGDGTQDGLLYDAFLLYDLNGNRTKKSGERLQADGERGKMSVTFRYDSMNRLTGEDREGAGERYAYDLCGNRLSKEQYRKGAVDVAEQYRYNERNELTERTAAGRRTAYRYDLNGSLVSEEEGGRKSEYCYDLLSRQTYVRTLDGREQENAYDGEGLRAGLKENGKKSVFLFHDGEILSECDGEGMPVRRHIHGAGLSHVQSLKDSTYHAYHQDEQGSTVYITGADNTAENCYRYDAFGNLTEKREGIHNRILYTGQQYDQETGQYYLRARYYNPVVGRFLQEDTYRGDGLNLYAYCANNPVGYFDPSGYQKCKNNSSKVSSNTPSSKKLRKNLIADGIQEPSYPNAAHHIVAGRATGAKDTRKILERYRININSAVNGVFLPTTKEVVGSTYHPSTHTKAYYNKVNSLLNRASSKKEVEKILQYISKTLSDGTFIK